MLRVCLRPGVLCILADTELICLPEGNVNSVCYKVYSSRVYFIFSVLLLTSYVSHTCETLRTIITFVSVLIVTLLQF